MEPIGIVFLFNMDEGTPKEVSKKFSDYFSSVTENLVRENLLELAKLKEIIDNKKIFWGGIKKDFEKVVENTDIIGDLALQVFKKHTDIEGSEDVHCLIYDGAKVPWNFTLMSCVIFK